MIGGGALWILGDLVGLPFLAAALIQMIREDEQEAAQVDAELDTRAQAAVPGVGEPGIVPGAGGRRASSRPPRRTASRGGRVTRVSPAASSGPLASS